MALFIDLCPGEAVDIENGRIVIEALAKTMGKRLRVSIAADRSIPVRRIGRTCEKVASDSRSPDHPRP